jgi:hypothetical protein
MVPFSASSSLIRSPPLLRAVPSAKDARHGSLGAIERPRRRPGRAPPPPARPEAREVTALPVKSNSTRRRVNRTPRRSTVTTVAMFCKLDELGEPVAGGAVHQFADHQVALRVRGCAS